MDNLTHSLIGAALGQAGLKRRTGLAMPALVIGANIPDIDAACFFWLDGTEHLAFRRGITHGPPALVLLPLLLSGTLLAWDRWQARRGTRPADRLPVRFGWLLLLSLLGTLSHPLFDWFNSYGIRLLEPFSSRWFYGDVLFIVDVWIWAMLGLGVWASRRRERAAGAAWRRPARVALGGLAGYVLLNMTISSSAEGIAAGDVPYAPVNVTNPVPVMFWQRQVLVRTDDGRYGEIRCTPLHCDRSGLVLRPTNMADPRIAQWARGNSNAQAFLFWSRMPIAEQGPRGMLLKDQRFLTTPTASSFQVELTPTP